MAKFHSHSFGNIMLDPRQEPDAKARDERGLAVSERELCQTEFVRDSNPQPRGDDLNIQRPEKIWLDPATMPSPAQLAPLQRKDLWTKYEVRDPRDQTQVNDKISRYLQHCTEQRVDGKEWKVGEMFAELEPLTTTFENLLPDKSRPWGASATSLMLVVGNASYSTATSSPRTTTYLSPPAKTKSN